MYRTRDRSLCASRVSPKNTCLAPSLPPFPRPRRLSAEPSRLRAVLARRGLRPGERRETRLFPQRRAFLRSFSILLLLLLPRELGSIICRSWSDLARAACWYARQRRGCLTLSLSRRVAARCVLDRGRTRGQKRARVRRAPAEIRKEKERQTRLTRAHL